MPGAGFSSIYHDRLSAPLPHALGVFALEFAGTFASVFAHVRSLLPAAAPALYISPYMSHFPTPCSFAHVIDTKSLHVLLHNIQLHANISQFPHPHTSLLVLISKRLPLFAFFFSSSTVASEEEPDDDRHFWLSRRMSSRDTSLPGEVLWRVVAGSKCSVKREEEGIVVVFGEGGGVGWYLVGESGGFVRWECTGGLFKVSG